MNDEQLERRLREAGLPGPRPELRAELLRRADRMMASRRRGRIIEWAFAAAAGLLIAVNIAFGHIEERRIEAIIGRATMARPVDPAAFAAMLAWRNQQMQEITGDSDRS